MKFKKTLTALVLSLAMVGALTLVAGAANGLQEIKAYLNSGITIKLDGEPQIFKDAGGTRVYPISYNGTTYLPLRAVAGLVGLDVEWDQATQTVLLGKAPGGVDLIETYEVYHVDGWNTGATGGQVRTSQGKTENISGVTQSHWIYLYCASVSYNLQGKHDTLTFSYYSNKDVVLSVLGDNGSVLGEYPITGGAVAETVTIPLFKTSELKFQTDKPVHNTASVRITDVRLDAE